MSGTAEQNAEVVQVTMAPAYGSPVSMLQLQTKAYSQYSAGVVTSAVSDRVLFPDIIIPKISGVFFFNAKNNLNGGNGDVHHWFSFTNNVLNTTMYVNGIWETSAGITQGTYMYNHDNINTWTGFPASLSLSINYSMFINGLNNSGRPANTFSARLSQVG
jgi:hypothetical protein